MAWIEGDRQRRVISIRMPRTMGRFMSLKSRRVIHWESQLERDLCYQLEFDPVVIQYREQPMTELIPYGGRLRRYTPDFLVSRRDGLVIYEVKPAEKAAKAKYVELFDAAAEHFANKGLRYQVMTEADIRRKPLINNIKMLLRYASEPVSDATVVSARTWINSHGPITIAEFADVFRKEGGLTLAYALIARQLISARIHTEVLTPKSVLGV